MSLRVATVSDLHTDFAENRELVVQLATEIHAKQADLVIVAGDISHEDERIERTLRAFLAVAPKVAYVPGNHDLWTHVEDLHAKAEIDTWDRYRVRLKEIAEKAGAYYLPSAPLVIGDVGFAGTAGWYDYSFAEPWVLDQLGADAFLSKRYGVFQWTDALLVAFRAAPGATGLMTDPEVAARMEAELEAGLLALESNPAVRTVVAVTHHQPFKEVVHRSGSLPWEFFCAFMGSAGLGERILRYPKVSTAVYGHSHIIGERQIGGRRVYGTALGYPRERRGLSVPDIVRTRIGWMEL
ncbi:MAG: metallophosphoesterase [Myxococcota bacterium]